MSTHPEESSLKELLRLTRAGEKAARETLFTQIRRYLEMMLWRLAWPEGTERPAKDSDSIQDALLVATREFHRFRGNSGTELRAWLRAILQTCRRNRNRANHAAKREFSRLRASARTDGASVGRQSVEPDDPLVQAEEIARLKSAIGSLPADYQLVLSLRAGGAPYTEIADYMQRTPDAVRQLWLRALVHVQKRVFHDGARIVR